MVPYLGWIQNISWGAQPSTDDFPEQSDLGCYRKGCHGWSNQDAPVNGSLIYTPTAPNPYIPNTDLRPTLILPSICINTPGHNSTNTMLFPLFLWTLHICTIDHKQMLLVLQGQVRWPLVIQAALVLTDFKVRRDHQVQSDFPYNTGHRTSQLPHH